MGLEVELVIWNYIVYIAFQSHSVINSYNYIEGGPELVLILN